MEEKKKKIFIVEDNKLNLKLFKDILESHNIETAYTKNGFEALSLIKKEKPDIILMDIQLQGISGFDIIKQVKSDDEIKDIPIIAVTAFAMKDDEQKILDIGCAEYISKPIFINPFLATIDKYLKDDIQVNSTK